jgi:hypothetical protein
MTKHTGIAPGLGDGESVSFEREVNIIKVVTLDYHAEAYYVGWHESLILLENDHVSLWSH